MRPPLKSEPKWGYFPGWPQDGDDWLHPADVATARRMIPSQRVFRREGHQADYMLLRYGGITLRVRPALWQEVPHEGLEIGQWVEVLSRGMLNEPRTGVIREMLWDERLGGIRYQIEVAGQPIAQLFAREDLLPIEPVA